MNGGARRGALRRPSRREVRDVATLAAPIVFVHLGMMAMGAVDAAMLGRVSPTAMAGGALGNLYWLLATMVGVGTVQAIDPIVSQAIGAGDAQAERHGVQRGIVLGGLLTFPTIALLLAAEPVLLAFGQPQDVAALAGQFCRVSMIGALPYYWFYAARQSLQAMQRTGPLLLTVVAANVVNAALNWMLIFGNLGAPALGVPGAALSSSVGRWVSCAMLIALGWNHIRPHLRGSWRASFAWPALRHMLRIGLPIGVHQWLEMAAFGGALLLMGLFGTAALAAHSATIQLAALAYMVPLGTSNAAAVLVGKAIGRRDSDGARREASAAIVCGVGFMALSALTFVAIPQVLIRLFTRDGEVIALALQLLPIAAAFQLFDGMQGVASGILRGAGDTRVPMLINLFGFVIVGVPVAAVLAFPLALGPRGVWWGLVICLVVVSTLLGWRVQRRLSGELARLEPHTAHA